MDIAVPTINDSPCPRNGSIRRTERDPTTVRVGPAPRRLTSRVLADDYLRTAQAWRRGRRGGRIEPLNRWRVLEVCPGGTQTRMTDHRFAPRDLVSAAEVRRGPRMEHHGRRVRRARVDTSSMTSEAEPRTLNAGGQEFIDSSVVSRR